MNNLRIIGLLWLLTVSAIAQNEDWFRVASEGVAAASGGPEIADTFTDTDGTALSSHVTTTGGYSWVAVATHFEIISGAVTNDAHASGTTLYYVNHTMSSADCTASIDMTNISGGGSQEASIGCRYNGSALVSETAYFVTYFGDTHFARLYKVVAGVSTALGSDSAASTTVTNLAVKVSGTTITGLTNGVQFTSATDATIAAAGFIGIGPGFRSSRDGTGMNYDNLKVTVP